ncbi:hypothetical protein LCGC14_2577390 [marine sediment metagenome]|uniref:DUF7831 domain-containing protein n=1 Tax=marine sediment metagenome TaxID=412755 RepID=A0A0F9AFV7_9ZZZZ
MWITKEMIEESTHIIFIFGDNLLQRGLGGQAKVCRPFVNKGKALGIPTKRKPTMYADAFFSDRDDEIRAVRWAIRTIISKYDGGYTIIFMPNIGRGYAKLPEKSPRIYKLISNFIKTFT